MARLVRRILPAVASALCVIALIVVLVVLVRRRANRTDGANGARVVPVTTRPAARRTFSRMVQVAGNVQTVDHALISARIPGVLDAIFVDEGDPVEANRTRLFQTDSVKLTRQVEIEQQQVEVAAWAVAEREANLARADADLEKAAADYGRFTRLYRDADAVTADEFEAQQNRYRQVQASLEHARASLELSRRQHKQAQGRLAIARKDLADSLVSAPLTGVVTERRLEPGERAAAGTVVLRIEDRSKIEISCRVSGQYAGLVRQGATEMRCRVNGVEVAEKVSYVSPTVDPVLRTFEVRCEIDNADGRLIPGLLADVRLILESREGLGVPRQCVLQRRDRQVVFVIDGATARQVTVKTGWATDGDVEILKGLDDGAGVATMGQFILRDGAAVKIVEGE